MNILAEWEFEHSIYTVANRKDAWDSWSDVDNHAKMEPGVECIELDGPFASGITGRTITDDYNSLSFVKSNTFLTGLSMGKQYQLFANGQ